jgi:lincosamide nucleotidyltransferase A/C/D/E
MDALSVVEVLDALDAAGIQTGMTGGWGVDALLCRQTRAHRDVDLGIAAEAVETAIRALAPLGYELAIDERPARLALHGQRGQVDIHPIVWDANGRGIQTGLNGEVFEYPSGSLDAVGEIAGRRVRCGTPQLQLSFHQGYEPAADDRQDMEALAATFDLELPGEWQDVRPLPG